MIPSKTVVSSLSSCTAGVIFVLMTAALILSSNLVSYSIAAPVVSKVTQAQVSQLLVVISNLI